jgi:hypothetical protein
MDDYAWPFPAAVRGQVRITGAKQVQIQVRPKSAWLVYPEV